MLNLLESRVTFGNGFDFFPIYWKFSKPQTLKAHKWGFLLNSMFIHHAMKKYGGVNVGIAPRIRKVSTR
jgi:hypothetical protein